MDKEKRASGIDVVGRVPWSTHFGLFYKTKQDLIDVLIPYFKAGLENNEFCMWVTAEPLDVDDARAEMARAMPDFNSYVDKGQIMIIPHTEWYTVDGVFDAGRVLNGWVEKLREAERKGFSGLRLTGNESWLDRSVWRDFIDYEQTVNDIVSQYKMIIVCSYPQDKCDASDVLDVAGTHQFVLSKRNGEWKLIEDQQQKKSREALYESEEKFRVLAETSPAAIFLYQGDKFIYVNPMAETLTGYSRDELFDGDAWGWIHPDFQDLVKERAKSRRLGERIPSRYEVMYRAKDGREGWVDFSAGLAEYEGKPAGLAMAFDVSKRKRAEEALATAKDHLAADLAGMSRLQEVSTRLVHQDNLGSLLGAIIEAAIEITDADMGNIQLYKGGDLKIVESRGFDRPFLDYFNSVHDNEAACGTAMVMRERVIVEDVTTSPIFMGKPSLDVMLVAGARAVQSTPLFSRSGRLLGMFSTHYRTPHRPWERELLLLDMLARQAADHIERIRGEEALKEAIQQAELYVDLMGHDINNINQSALGYLELALQALESEKKLRLDDKVLIERPMHALANSTALISNVRKLQKLVKEGVKTEPTDLYKLFRELESMSFYSHDRDVLINFQQVQGIMVQANDLLKDALFNLIANAVKHSDDEKQLIVNVKVEPVNENGLKYYKIMVEDNGPGIPDEMKDRLFHRFQRGTTKAQGKGLGLYIVRTLVEGYHGKVWVENRVKDDHTKGSRFVVMLPTVEK